MKKKEFLEHFKRIKSILYMQDIDVIVSFENKEDDATAESKFQYRTHYIDINPELLRSDKENIIDTIFHELLHYYLGFYRPFMQSLKEDFNWKEKEVLIATNGIQDLEELSIVQLARCLTKFYLRYYK